TFLQNVETQGSPNARAEERLPWIPLQVSQGLLSCPFGRDETPSVRPTHAWDIEEVTWVRNAYLGKRGKHVQIALNGSQMPARCLDSHVKVTHQQSIVKEAAAETQVIRVWNFFLHFP
uniref:Uncharacterized protein n=1 Tax=Callithrix jacchus TaxID=9483 RepID=A0A8I3WSI7_CALJA